MHEKFRQLLESSQKILITSHISPDPDAICSALLLGRTLQANYPDKAVAVVLEEKPSSDLSFLENYEQIRFQQLDSALTELRPQLLIITDAGGYNRISRIGAAKVRDYAKTPENGLKTVVIDHHEPDEEEVELVINNRRPATSEEIYVLCFEQLRLKKPTNYAETALLGIISDTQRHKFDHPGYRETYRIVSQLRDEGASIEKLENRRERYNQNELVVLGELASNIVSEPAGYTFSYIGDDFTKKWTASGKPVDDLKNGCELFVNQFIRNLEDNRWGFVIYPELVAGDGVYGVSLRSQTGARDVSELARALGGGGHKPAAGVKIKAKSVQEAIDSVKKAIVDG